MSSASRKKTGQPPGRRPRPGPSPRKPVPKKAVRRGRGPSRPPSEGQGPAEAIARLRRRRLRPRRRRPRRRSWRRRSRRLFPSRPSRRSSLRSPARPAGREHRRRSRHAAASPRCGAPDGQPLQPGELLLPGGPQNLEEILYLFRGVIASQRVGGEVAIGEVVAKRPAGDPLAARPELERHYGLLQQRFSTGSIESTLPNRPQPKLTFQGFVERARQRRREIGGFLRGLDIGKTSPRRWTRTARTASTADGVGGPPREGDGRRRARAGGLQPLPPRLDVFDERTESLVVDLEKTLRRLGPASSPELRKGERSPGAAGPSRRLRA